MTQQQLQFLYQLIYVRFLCPNFSPTLIAQWYMHTDFTTGTLPNAVNQLVRFVVSVDPVNRWVDVISLRCPPFDHQVEIIIISQDEPRDRSA